MSMGEEAFGEMIHLVLNPSEPPASSPSPAQKKATEAIKKAEKKKAEELKRWGVPPNEITRRLKDKKPGGVLFIDEAHMLDPASSKVGREIFNHIMDSAEDNRAQLTFILAGYKHDIERNLYCFNVGMKSRFDDILFRDYEFEQLLEIWNALLARYSGGGVNWSCDKKVAEVAVRRVSRGKDRHGFGNGRDLRNAFETAARHAQARSDFDPAKPQVAMYDVIGPEPSEGHLDELRSALSELRALDGLLEVCQLAFRIPISKPPISKPPSPCFLWLVAAGQGRGG